MCFHQSICTLLEKGREILACDEMAYVTQLNISTYLIK
jgi:hypothetical protein